ncbi:MAG: hypothetical protein WC445_03585 [Patescibacteria group bacterium]
MAKVTLAQLHELGEQIKRGQIPVWKARAVFGLSEKETETPLDMYLALTKAAKAELMTAEQLQALLEGKDETLGIFKVTVDYGLTLEQMIAAGRYNNSGDDINELTFPVSGEGKVERELVLVPLRNVVSTDDALVELDRRGLRPAKIEELLAFSASLSWPWTWFSIVALGPSFVGWTDRRCFVCHDRCGEELTLRVRSDANDWCGWTFLAVRKDAA